MQQRFPRRIDALADVHAFLERFREEQGVPEDVGFRMDLVVEELFTNLVKYNTDGRFEIEVGARLVDGEVVLTLTDFDVDSFDVTTSKEPDPDRGEDNIRIGGLGLHLVKQMADSLSYEYTDRTSRTTLVLRLERGSADDHAE